MNSLAAQIMVKILNLKMNMPADRVVLRDQNYKIPGDPNLFIVVGMVHFFPMASNTRMETVDNAQVEISEMVRDEVIQIDIVSRNNDALLRNHEVIMAMQSFYAQQLQELNNFKIFRIPQGCINASAVEGGAQLNRYTVRFHCHVWYRLQVALNSPLGDYYDYFTTRFDDEQTIGNPDAITYDQPNENWDTPGQNYDQPTPLIEFVIDSEGIET